MGSRGAFVDVNIEDFTFIDGGQNYYSIGTLSSDNNVKILIQNRGSVKAPEFSHTDGRIYAIVQDGKLKHIVYYDSTHKQHICIDLLHPHKGVQPHVHINLNHDYTAPAIPPTPEQIALIEKIKKEFHLL